MSDILVEVKELKKHFLLSRDVIVKAIDGVSFAIRKGESLGIVGESGCGKTTLGRMILKLLPSTSGKIYFDGKDLDSLTRSELRRIRRRMQIVFQDPYSSLNPRMSVGSILSFPMKVHKLHPNQRQQRIAELLETVGLQPSDVNRYPHEFSGGQLQRIGIARALAVEPTFIVADEPVSALDVSIQSQILNLLKDLQERLLLTYFFISHDLTVVEFISDRIAVLYLGKVVELGPADQMYQKSYHPYTKNLISAVPLKDPNKERQKNRIRLTGEVPTPINPPPGCSFHTRCTERTDMCRESAPALAPVDEDHYVACHLYSR